MEGKILVQSLILIIPFSFSMNTNDFFFFFFFKSLLLFHTFEQYFSNNFLNGRNDSREEKCSSICDTTIERNESRKKRLLNVVSCYTVSTVIGIFGANRIRPVTSSDAWISGSSLPPFSPRQAFVSIQQQGEGGREGEVLVGIAANENR